MYFVILLVSVDDILILSNTQMVVEDTVVKFRETYEMTLSGKADKFLGMSIVVERDTFSPKGANC